MSKIKLKPCPFCEGKAEFCRMPIRTRDRWSDSVVVQCQKCGIRTIPVLYDAVKHPNDEEYEEAAAKWNNRKPTQQKSEQPTSGDLISRKAVIDIIHKEIERTSSYLEHETQINIECAVEQLPTAFDLDKVVQYAETFDCEELCDVDDYYDSGYSDGWNSCIDKIKKGMWFK